MSDTEPTKNTNSSTPDPSSTGAPSGTPSPSEWRAGQHTRFAGRSAEEILGIAEAQQNQLDRFNQPVPQPAPQPNAFDLDAYLPDGEYADNSKVKQLINRIINQPPQVDHVGRQQAAGALLATVQMKRADEFKRWGPEINQELARLSPDYWTLDNLSTIVDIVKSRHVDELATEKGRQLFNESHPTIRSGTGGSGSVSQQNISLDGEGVPSSWALAAKQAGVDEAKVREFCDLTGQTVEQYMADLLKYGKGATIRG